MKRGQFVILHLLTLQNQNRKRETGLYVCGIMYRKSISGMTINSVTQGYWNNITLSLWLNENFKKLQKPWTKILLACTLDLTGDLISQTWKIDDEKSKDYCKADTT